MRPARTGEGATTPAGWTIDGPSTVRFAIAFAVAVALLALVYRHSGTVRWPQVLGNIQDTRVVADYALETKWGGEVTWRAEYKVAYSVGGREYTVWSDSGIRGESEADVRLDLPHSYPSCRVRARANRARSPIATAD
jgi:hypothetical protein